MKSPQGDRSPTAVMAALAIAALGFLPIANWIPGGRDDPWYSTEAGGWISGTIIAVGVGLVLAIASRKFPVRWTEGIGSLPRSFASAEKAWIAGLAALALVVYLIIAQTVFSGRPLLIDEITQVMQARIFAAGRLWQPTDPAPEFVSSLLMVDVGLRTYAQFPAGGPAMLAPGELIGLTWVVTPLFAALSVLLFGMLLRDLEPHPGSRLLALALFAFAPFVALMAGSHMNHVTCGTWLLLGILGAVRSNLGQGNGARWALAGGLGFGVAATIRPLDAAAFVLPAALWSLASALRNQARWKHALSAATGLALPVALLAWVNWRTTGGPFQFGYEILWGKGVGPGFHPSPWGEPHTPALGLELVSLYFIRLQTYLFESPVPSLLPVIGSLLLARRLGAADRFLICSGAMLVGFYFAYWHDGFYLGPRYMYPLAPILALWAGRLPSLVRERFGSGLLHRGAVFSMATAACVGLAVLLPTRVREYRDDKPLVRWNVEAAEAKAGVRNSLVLVRESWGAQLVARMWALGVSRHDSEQLYKRVNRCALERAVTGLESLASVGSLPPGTASDTLLALLGGLRAVVQPAGFRSDMTCQRRADEDQAGYLVLAPLQLAGGQGNVYVRDLHGHNRVMLERYPGRPVYLLTAAPGEGAEPRFYPVAVDSMLADTSSN